MEILQDKNGIYVCLIDCQLVGNQLHCGAARFKGGISGVIQVSDINGKHIFNIKIPDSVSNSATSKIFSSPINKVEIELWQ